MIRRVGIAITSMALLITGCAVFGTGHPPNEQCYIAIRSYSILLTTANAWYEDHAASVDEQKAVMNVIQGARPFRESCERLAVQCEDWSVQSGRPLSECPQQAKIAATAGNLEAFVAAGNQVMGEWIDDE